MAHHQDKSKPRGNNKYTAEHARIWREMRRTMKWKEVAKETGVNIATMQRVMNEHAEYGFNPDHPHYGHSS